MNYLQLCQKAHTLCGLQGTFSSVTTTTTYQVTLAKFVAEAWVDIQNLRKDWPFLRSSVTINGNDSETEYSLATIFPTGSDIARWVDQIYWVDSDGAFHKLTFIPYDEYIDRQIATSGSTYPTFVAEDPVDRHLYFNPMDTDYTIVAHYITTPVVLADNTDEPLLPPAFHNLIAYLGAAQMAAFLSNTNMYNLLATKADSLMGSLMRSELPSNRMKVTGIC